MSTRETALLVGVIPLAFAGAPPRREAVVMLAAIIDLNGLEATLGQA